MFAPQPPSQPESVWPPRQTTTTPGIPPPPSYLPQAMPPQVMEAQIGPAPAMRRFLRIPLGKAIVTPVVLAILVVIYIPMALFPDVNDWALSQGANNHIWVAQGEWWRLITSTLLHGGLLHIGLNGYALYIIGMDLEALVGRARFAAIYAISGLAGSVASFAFTPANVPSVGASGAIFGLVGALGVYFGLHRHLFGRMGNLQFWNIIIVIVINLAIGFSGFFPIDNSAHMGGLLAGAAVGYVLCPRYTLGEWASPIVRNVVNTNKGYLPWIAAALIGLLVVFTFFALLLMFQSGILTPVILTK